MATPTYNTNKTIWGLDNDTAGSATDRYATMRSSTDLEVWYQTRSQVRTTDLLDSIDYTIVDGNPSVLTLVFKDADSVTLTTVRSGRVYLSSLSTGADLHGTAADTFSINSSTGTVIASAVDNMKFFITNASGSIKFNIADAATPTYYMCIELPSGELSVSAIITPTG